MPKVRRKRQRTEKTPINRRAKALALSTSSDDQNAKAVYFDLATQPNSSIKSKSTDKFIQVSKTPRNLKIPIDWDVKPGDVLSWSTDRPTETFFVTIEGTLLKNPDSSGSGYLTIPLSITTQFPDAIDHFSTVLNCIGLNYVSSIELAPTDLFFIKHFSKKQLPTSVTNRADVSYSFDPNDKILHVTIASKSNQTQDFPLETTKTDDILQWLSSSNDTKAELVVKYKFEGKETCKKVPGGIIIGLPIGWKCEQQGSVMFSENKIQGEWKCTGPEKTKEKARKAVDKHYAGLNIEIK